MLTLTVALTVGEATAAVFYPFYLWITFGMGFRYGHRYLLVSALLSLAGFALVIALTDYWRLSRRSRRARGSRCCCCPPTPRPC